MSKNKTSWWDILFGTNDSFKKSTDTLDDLLQRCSECGEYFEACECNCDDEDCHNEGD